MGGRKKLGIMKSGLKQLGLIGKTLSHSFSKNYFAEKFEREDINDFRYDNFELTSIEEFPDLIKSTPNLLGLNVTIPYKKEVMPFLDEISEEAQAVGAVNTILKKKNKLFGYNTDVIGFQQSLEPLLKSHHTKALILGTGGAAKAVAYVLNQLGIKFLFISRTPSENQLTYSQVDASVLESYPIVINTTPLGMYPKVDVAPGINFTSLNKQHLLYDLIYNPVETLFLQKGKARGATTKNGLQMLERQAEAAWAIWTKH